MGQVLLMLVVALTVAAVVFGVAVLVTGRDPGLVPAEPDGRAVPLPGDRPLRETDVEEIRFDTVLRGYQMAQVDRALRRAAYDLGYKSELIGVLEAEVAALREGRTADAEALRRAREQSALGGSAATGIVAVSGDDRPGGSADVAVSAAEPFVATNGVASGGTSFLGPARADSDDPAPARSKPADGAGGPGPVVRSEPV
ncbi:DivIVA domain-containing protein [Micromonospora musae]|uniref:DivIVA domain-containing protein n=1 Tax=Micromonospora musae TaxID=1894970 RepID=A0A3A9YI14_9ACTN|nr:DivIVA domain-containing protein [Micromonospora musae]RKN23838.1 DivIVA domain-containing protein [Micromonospora musae]RKN31847.1 DivIVA domain-containing protein [Micromonospora musae]